MSKTLLGDAKAYIPGTNGEKARYLTIGAAFKDSEDGRISFKIDTLPVEGSGWTGWVNVFARDASGSYQRSQRSTAVRDELGPLDDDIPF